MRIEGVFIGSRIGRRIAGSFIVAAAAPVLVLGALGWSAWSTHIAETTVERLQRELKYDGMRTFDKLTAARSALAAAASDEDLSAPAVRRRLADAGLPVVVRVPGTPADAVGAATPESRLTAWWTSAPSIQGVSVRPSEADDAPPDIVMAVADTTHGGMLVGQIDARWLWSDTFHASNLDAGCVRGDGATALYCLGEMMASATAVRTQWELFLGPDFGGHTWTFEGRTAALDAPGLPGLSAGGLAACAAAAVLLVASVLSMVLVRRILLPLRALIDGTRRLTDGDDAARVTVRGNDELARLGTAFNKMAGRLASQTRTLAHRATHDSLTGLLNRSGLQEALDRAAGAAHHAGGDFALLLLDLDHFSAVNDTFGHETGDHLLCDAAHRLRRALPCDAVVARQGGDEFVALLPGADAAQATAAASTICAEMARPFELDGRTLAVGASVGIVHAPRDGDDAVALLRRADLAMYVAKAAGRGGAVRFEPSMDDAAQQRTLLLQALRLAIPAGELRLEYQPRVQARDDRVHSAEALVRWWHPTLGRIGPDRFIGLAEDSGLIDALGHWVLDAACAQVAAWRRGAGGPVRVSVNVSVRQLRRNDFAAEVAGVLSRHGLPGEALELEVTESVMSEDPAGTAARLAELRAAGVTLALDDFGTGYSSMVYLRQLPINVLKIDRAFVADLGRDPAADDIARAIIALARALDLRLVAEGVETEAQDALLRDWGVDELQGYLHARPMTAEALERWQLERSVVETAVGA